MIEEPPEDSRFTVILGEAATAKTEMIAAIQGISTIEVVRRALSLYACAVLLEDTEWLAVVRSDSSLDKVLI